MASDHGKKHRAGHVIKTVLAVIGGITVVLAVLLVALAYELNYAVRTVDTSTSPDGRFTLELQAVGEPLFFSPADARLVLRLGRYEVSHVDTSIADDGGQVRTTSWQVSWKNSGAEVRLKGSEQSDELVTMGFDGSVSKGRAAADESLGGLPDAEANTPATPTDEDTTSSEVAQQEAEEIDAGYKAVYDAALKSQGYGYQREGRDSRLRPRVRQRRVRALCAGELPRGGLWQLVDRRGGAARRVRIRARDGRGHRIWKDLLVRCRHAGVLRRDG